MAADGWFIGVVLVARDGEPVLQKAYGERGSQGPVRINTPMGIASGGKMFTAVAIGQLVERGALRFDDPAGKYVDELPTDVRRATISQLLSHTSGLGMYSIAEGIVYPTGEFHYSNAGFDLLAKIVERGSGHQFADFLRRGVFVPAGMKHTTVDQGDGEDPPGAGGEESTAPDLLRFSNALLGYRLMDARTTREMIRPRSRGDWGGYGYGFATFTGKAGEVESIGHIGAIPNVVTAVEMNPGLGYTVIVVCQVGFESIEPALIRFQKAIGMGYWRR